VIAVVAHAADWPRVWAHRCGGRLAPENTLAGLRAAASAGCRGVEFDVMLSADGVPLLIHDETLERTTNGRGAVAETPIAQLRALDAGAWFGAQFAGERLPTLEEAVRTCRALGLFMNIEIKPAARHEVVTGQVVAARVAELGGAHSGDVLLSSFSEPALDAARDAAPGLARGMLVGRVPADWQQRCERLACVALHARVAGLAAEQVRAVKAAGYCFVTYTVNEPARARELLSYGADVLITDCPDQFGALG
jgi:glycerophosphoryl diester phosphodiesterase